MAKLNNIAVYEWQAWRGFLISHLVEDSGHIKAEFEDDISTLEAALNPDIKAVLLHFCLSRTDRFPAKREQILDALEARGILVLNRGITDISKANLHRILQDADIPTAKAEREGEPQERLFIKSNLNYGGVAEQRLPEHIKAHLGIEPPGPIRDFNQYYAAAREHLPEDIWHNNAITIERHITNPEDSFYRVYGFGDALVVVKAHTRALIKKLSGNPRDTNAFYTRDQIINDKTPLPGDLQSVLSRFIQRIPLAFFCLDIVHDLEHFYIVDLNTTPWSGEQPQTGEAVDFMCQGANDYLKRVLTQ